jgi:hypothetical protein
VTSRDRDTLLLLKGVRDGTSTAGRASALPFSERIQALDDLAGDLLRRCDAPSTPGLTFLASFLKGNNLTQLLGRELATPEALEHFARIDARKSLRLLPRGVVCHWTAGNVPLLAMFSWALSALVGNRNVIRLSSRSDDVISPLLRRLASVSAAGRQLADETTVLHFDRDDTPVQEAMSRLADVRVVWGGHEAVDAIRALPCDWECDTVVLGPRVSLAVVDPAAATEAAIGRLITDIVYFDQLACSSPQWLFLKGRPGDKPFDTVVEWMASEFTRQSHRFPRHPLGFDETYRIQLDRARVLLDGGALKRDSQTRWTMAMVDTPHAGVSCTNRFLQVVPFTDFRRITPHIPRNVQTIVTLLCQTELERFSEEAAACGVCRFPRPGEGNHFETPWDGLSLISRLTRWVLRTDGPAATSETGVSASWTIPISSSSN